MSALSPAWLTEHAAVVEAVTLRHLFTLYPGEIACDCEWTAKDDGSRAGDERLIAAWSKHHAQEVTAALAAEAEKGGA